MRRKREGIRGEREGIRDKGKREGIRDKGERVLRENRTLEPVDFKGPENTVTMACYVEGFGSQAI